MHPSEVFIPQFSTPTCGTLEPRICSDTGREPEGLLEELEVVLDYFNRGQELCQKERNGIPVEESTMDNV